jgi:hypothetical protein
MKTYIQDLNDIYYHMLVENIQLLTEMFVIGNEKDDYYVIAYRDKILQLNLSIPQSSQEVISQLEQMFGVSVEELNNIPSIYGLSGLISSKGNKQLEILYGMYDKSKNTLILLDLYYNMFKDPKESILVKKIAHQLKIPKIILQSNNELIYDRDDLNNKQPAKIYYHGTSSSYLKSILNNGLDSNTINSGFNDKIREQLKDNIFITSNFLYSLNHAVRTAKNTKGFPVIIELNIRFQDLLQPDYDVNLSGYSGDKNKALKVSKEIGVYGYKGKIYPYNFQDIILTDQTKSYNQYQKEDFKSMNWQLLRNAFNQENVTSEDIIHHILH